MQLTSRTPNQRTRVIDRLWWMALIISLTCLIALWIFDSMALY